MSRRHSKISTEDIAREIRVELRGILRRYFELREPLRHFVRDPLIPLGGTCHYLMIGRGTPCRSHNPLKGSIKCVSVPDERIQHEVLEFAGTVWHLKDRLQRFARATKQAIDLEAHAKGKTDLLVCADLINAKKHSGSDNRSGFSPRLGNVEFDTSQSGVIELRYDGARKLSQIAVTIDMPIPYRVDIEGRDGIAVEEDAVRLIYRAFRVWLPLICDLGILNGDDPESIALRHDLHLPDAAS